MSQYKKASTLKIFPHLSPTEHGVGGSDAVCGHCPLHATMYNVLTLAV